MDVLLYMMFSCALYLWTISSLTDCPGVSKMVYLMGMLLLSLFVLIAAFLEDKKQNRRGLMIAAMFINIGLSISCRVGSNSEDAAFLETFMSSYAGDLLPMIILFAITLLVIRYTKIYKLPILNLLLTAFLPIAIFGARLTGRAIGGSYLYFAGVMIFGLVLTGFPFVAAYFLSGNENRYRKGSVRNLSWNLMGLLLYTFFLYIGCVVCNEFGLLLVLGLTTTVLFFIRCRNGVTKFFYTIACGGACIAAAIKVSHVASRIQIWLNPKAAYGNAYLEGKAESVLYVFRNFYRMGWWGNGIGDLSKRIYPTLDTDHVLVTLMNDYSFLLTVMVILLGILFVRWMLIQPSGLGIYDRYLNLSCALIVGFIILIDVASNLGSFIIAGIGYPWISNGSSVNLMLMCLLAVHMGLLGRRKNQCCE